MPLNAIRYPFINSPKPLFKPYVHCGILRSLGPRLNQNEIESMVPPSLQTYRDFTSASGLPEDIEEFKIPGQSSAYIAWLGARPQRGSARKFLLYVHGGGFQLSLSLGHLKFVEYLRKDIEEELSVAVLVYSLTPENKYPLQFHQAVLAIQSLLDRGVEAKDILMAGDSAGGNIILSVLSHLLHKHPAVPALTPRSTPFATAICISPAVSHAFDPDEYPSMRTNATRDMITVKMLRKWCQLEFAGTSYHEEVENGEYWGTFLEAPRSWWGGLGRVVRRVEFTAGKCETFCDGVVRFAEKLNRVAEMDGFGVGMCVAPREIHDAPMDDFLNARGAGETSQRVREWVQEIVEKTE